MACYLDQPEPHTYTSRAHTSYLRSVYPCPSIWLADATSRHIAVLQSLTELVLWWAHALTHQSHELISLFSSYTHSYILTLLVFCFSPSAVSISSNQGWAFPGSQELSRKCMSVHLCGGVCKAMLLLSFLSDVRLNFVHLISVLENSSGDMPALGGDYSN